MQIIENDLASTDVTQLLQEHLDQMHATSPAESVHALDIKRGVASFVFWPIMQAAREQGMTSFFLESGSMSECRILPNRYF